jgi:DNA repair protein RecO (recombination protein O)
MRHKYETRGIVLSRGTLGEANTLMTLLTPDLGLVRARAQGLRRSGAKLAAALTTLSESEVILVHGKEGWRLAGAVLQKNWFLELRHSDSETRAARVCQLLLRLIAGETQDTDLYPVIIEFFNALATLPKETHETAEVLVALRMLGLLGLDTGSLPQGDSEFAPEVLAAIHKDRARYILRINQGITASGL